MLGLLPQSIMDESDVDPDLPGLIPSPHLNTELDMGENKYDPNMPGLIPSPHKPSVDMNNPRSLDDETCVVQII